MSTQPLSRFHASPIGGGGVARSSADRVFETLHALAIDVRPFMSGETGS